MGSFIRKITIRNYKSIAACAVELPMLAFIVGPNGAGKSNFLDCFRFVADSLTTSIDHALRERGTIREVRRRSGGHPTYFSIRLDFELPNETTGHFSFRVGGRNGGFEVQEEQCFVQSGLFNEHYYHVKSGHVIAKSSAILPAILPDRLFLVSVSALPEFRPVFTALSRMQVYNLNPEKIRSMQRPDPGEILRRDGANIASIFRHISTEYGEKINEYMSKIVDGLTGTEANPVGTLETLTFRQRVKGQKHPWKFFASSMSDGTLRAFGVLVAIFQHAWRGDSLPNLIGLEEPEVALHPAAAWVLLAALREASQENQVIVTSHSPDLLDNPDIAPESLLAVDAIEGITRIGNIDAAGKEALRQQLFTAGELLSQNQIAVDPETPSEVGSDQQSTLFRMKEENGK